MCAGAPASFWRENSIAVFILLRPTGFSENTVARETLTNVGSVSLFFLIGRGLTFLNKNNRVNFSVEKKKKGKMKLGGGCIF